MILIKDFGEVARRMESKEVFFFFFFNIGEITAGMNADKNALKRGESNTSRYREDGYWRRAPE